LEKAIRSHIDHFQKKHPEIHIHLDAVQEGALVPMEKRLALYRIYQEAINNILKHAEATEVTVRFRKDQEKAILEIQDNGKGFEEPPNELSLVRQGHFGLVGIRERAEAVGGFVEIISQAGEGTQIQVIVPVQV